LTVEQLFNIKTVTVKEERIGKQEHFYGYVKADEAARYDIVPRFGGYIETLHADRRFTYIEKGQPLARVYSPEVLRAKEEYRGTLRYHKSHGNEAMLKSAREKLELLGVPHDEINAVSNMKHDLRHTTIYAPVSGYLFEKKINNGSAFKAKAKLFEIVDLSSVWVEARIAEEKIADIRSKRFSISSKAFPKHFDATSPLLYPDISTKEALATLRLNVLNPANQLFPGMYVTVKARSGEQNYLSLPKSAVIRKNGTWYAFTVGEYEGEYEPIEVKVKPLDQERYAIIEGLKAGQEVVNNALFMMDSDAQVNGLY
jgi:Cu(I)/Ag(I) efflux system membrane fusion protein